MHAMSVWGCCVGRNIFNAPQLLDSVSVKNFIFQITPYSCFDVPLNIPYEKFDLPIFTKFEKECLDFNLNKTCIDKLELIGKKATVWICRLIPT